MEEVTESCGNSSSRGGGSHDGSGRLGRRSRHKSDVYDEVLRKLRDSDFSDLGIPGFEDDLWSHFNRLPIRYALDVNLEKAEDVLLHKRLLKMAQDPATRPAIEVRLAQELAILGYVDSSSVMFSTEIRSKWLAHYLAGGFALPTIREMETDVDKYRWNRTGTIFAV